MNPDLTRLHPYPFEALAELKQGLKAPEQLKHIALSIGEPQHAAPDFVIDSLRTHLHQVRHYPSTLGTLEFRQTIAEWICRRFSIAASELNPETHILPVNGTREALFALAQAVVERSAKSPLVLMPNPFYQIYEGAAVLAGAAPGYLNCTAETGFLPDLDTITPQQWSRCQLFYICSPGNPTGAVMSETYLQRLIDQAQKHDFVIASDECYAEIYLDEKPPGLLGAASRMGLSNFDHCLAFHSLSKRSNLPGLRSGFVAGDARIIEKFRLYRTYHGCAMPTVVQAASIVAWRDEDHVAVNRSLYREKFERVLTILSATLAPEKPQAGFYLWPSTPIPDKCFTRRLYAEKNITLLPGQFLSRTTDTGNPGQNRIRIALVAPLDDCIEAAQRINHFVSTL